MAWAADIQEAPVPALLLALAACAAQPRELARAHDGQGRAATHGRGDANPDTDAATASLVDAGTLELTLRGRPFGRESFAIERRPDGYVLRAEVQLTAGSTLRLLDGELVTDLAWRPLRGRFRDVKDGGTITTLDGAPLVLRGTAPFAPPSERTASREVSLFLADHTLSHFTPLCAIAAPAVRVGFPGMDVTVGADEPRGALVRRRVDLGGTMRALLLCEAGKLIAVEVPVVGLVAVRAGRAADVAAAATRPRGKPALAPGLLEDERRVRVAAGRHGEAAELACSLVTPAGRADRRGPAVVLITGSGAQDRDGDTVGPSGIKLGLLKVLASALGEAGVTSLRCDDRGTGASTGAFGAATLDTFVADAAAITAALRREPGIDRRRVILVGHSEGAVVATRVAARDRAVAGLVLLAGPGRDLDVVLLEQVEHTLRRAGLTDAEVAEALAHHRDAFAAIAAGEPLPDTAEAREWAGGEAWLRSHLRHDVLATAATVRAPAVLIVQGGVDRQVSQVDAELLAAAFRAGGNPRVTLAVHPSLNHNFAASATGDVAEYVDPDLAVDPSFVAEVVAFVAGVSPAR